MKFSLKHLVKHVQIAFKTFYRAVWHGYYPAYFVGIFFGVLFLLQWIFEYEQFYEVVIVNNAGLSVLEIFDFLFDALMSFFRYPDDLTPISLMIISFFQAAILIIWMRSREFKNAHKASMGALGIGLLGSGCVACASSLLSVFLSVFGATVSVAFVRTLGDVLLVVAVLLSAKAFIDLGVKTSGYFHE